MHRARSISRAQRPPTSHERCKGRPRPGKNTPWPSVTVSSHQRLLSRAPLWWVRVRRSFPRPPVPHRVSRPAAPVDGPVARAGLLAPCTVRFGRPGAMVMQER